MIINKKNANLYNSMNYFQIMNSNKLYLFKNNKLNNFKYKKYISKSNKSIDKKFIEKNEMAMEEPVEEPVAEKDEMVIEENLEKEKNGKDVEHLKNHDLYFFYKIDSLFTPLKI